MPQDVNVSTAVSNAVAGRINMEKTRYGDSDGNQTTARTHASLEP